MKKILLCIIALNLSFASCNKMDIAVWDAKMVSRYNKIVDDIESFEESISLNLIEDSLAITRILDKKDQLLANIEQLEVVLLSTTLSEEAEQYQTSLIDFLESAKKQMAVGVQFVQFTENTLDSEIEYYAAEYDSVSDQTAQKANIYATERKKILKNSSR